MKKPDIVAMSANSDLKDVYRQAAISAGADQFFLKGSALISYFREIQNRVIALVDDDHSTRETLTTLFSFENTVYSYKSAAQALEEIPTKEPPVDMVVTDIQMFPMNGVVFIKKLIELCTPK